MKPSSRVPSESQTVVIRPCSTADLPGVARLAARLVREHHAMDAERFMIFDNIEEGYAAYLGAEMRKRKTVVLVAALADQIVGYAYGRIEPRDWNALREQCGMLHDVYVDEAARGQGLGAGLVEQAVRRLTAGRRRAPLRVRLPSPAQV